MFGAWPWASAAIAAPPDDLAWPSVPVPQPVLQPIGGDATLLFAQPRGEVSNPSPTQGATNWAWYVMNVEPQAGLA